MLRGDDVVADRETQARALPGRLGREKWLEQPVAIFRRDAGAVVAHPDLDLVDEIARGHFEPRGERRVVRLVATLAGGVKAVADQIEEGTGHILRHQFDR
jgi:hypothetical protein